MNKATPFIGMIPLDVKLRAAMYEATLCPTHEGGLHRLPGTMFYEIMLQRCNSAVSAEDVDFLPGTDEQHLHTWKFSSEYQMILDYSKATHQELSDSPLEIANAQQR